MNKLEITLKQHTPLLHFQPMQEGATLRASEVKPKLDKFLLTALGEGEYREGVEKARKKGWLIGDSCALNYKMRIISSDAKSQKVKMSERPKGSLFTTKNYPNDKNSMIMGNMSKEGLAEEELLNFIFFSSHQIAFAMDNEKLGEHIASNVKDFFDQNCFGNRTSKGFGSFSVIAINGERVSGLPEYDYYIDLRIRTETEIEIYDRKLHEDIFTFINVIWKLLKKGSGKKGTAQDAPLLNLVLDKGVSFSRIPSVIKFKPNLYQDRENWRLFLGLIVDEELPDYTIQGFGGLYDYVDAQKEKIPVQKLDSLVSKLNLNYEFKISNFE